MKSVFLVLIFVVGNLGSAFANSNDEFYELSLVNKVDDSQIETVGYKGCRKGMVNVGEDVGGTAQTIIWCISRATFDKLNPEQYLTSDQNTCAKGYEYGNRVYSNGNYADLEYVCVRSR